MDQDVVHVYAGGYYLATKEQMPFEATGMDPEITVLSEVNQKDKYHNIAYIWSQMTQTDLSKKQKQTHSENRPMVAKGERVGSLGLAEKTVTC